MSNTVILTLEMFTRMCYMLAKIVDRNKDIHYRMLCADKGAGRHCDSLNLHT